ncbi:MAG TPA: pentapeptide repeat-containing protein [Thermoanaerobaculia bacterium]|nr:pentapeptide repeat-containing protein [Thermoanaerobaculia bacterium]
MSQDLPLKIVGDSGERHKPAPLGTRDGWKLVVRVGSAIIKEYSVDELLRLEPAPYGAKTGIHCVSSGGIIRSRGEKSVTFGGVRFSRLFENLRLNGDLGPIAGLRPTVRFISAAPGGCGPRNRYHWTALPLRDCLDPANGVMLATDIDDVPLPYGNGGPLRSIVGDSLYFYKAVKWLAEIRFCRGPHSRFLGTWEDYAGYHNRARTAFAEQFQPRMREIQEVLRDKAGQPSDVSRVVPRKAWRQTWEKMSGRADLSRLIVSRLDEMDLALPTDFRKIIFSEGDFKAKIRGTLFKGCTFAGANLEGCNFSLSRFSNTDFSEKGDNPANLTGCDLEGANLQSAYLRNVPMRGAWLSNAVFTQDFKATDRVNGLEVKEAHDLDEKTRAWLADNGASV